ncbi:RCC1 domain-containing protein [Bdellovibrio bacteriovorus]|uniref:RCC1 domain-containing protein n=1 Tax=Bdellovibrio bacteriovorus TaxID=959 RepID=UPI003AA8FB26
MIFHGTLPPSPLKAITRFFLVLLTSLLTGCTLDSVIQALTKEDFKLLTYPDTNYVDVNSSTLNLEGHCDVAEGTVTLKLDSVEKEKLTCPETGLWQYQLDVASLGDGEVNLTVEQVELADATKNIKSATVTLNKDTTPPQLLAMPDIILNDKGYISWDCQNLNDKCTFRSFVSTTDLFTFAAEPYTNLKSNVTFPDGKSYLFLQAKDAAGNLSAIKKIEVYSGAMGILLNPMQMKLAMDQSVTLRFYIPQVFASYTLFNNADCTGSENWQARVAGAHLWSLPSATPALYAVSAKFRTATGIVSQCFTDKIPIVDVSTNYDICSGGSSSAAFGMVRASLYPQSPGYNNNENCAFTVNTTDAMDIVPATTIQTETDKDILSVKQQGQTLYAFSGSFVPSGLMPLTSTQPGPFTINFQSDGQNTDAGFLVYWMPKDAIRQEITINDGASQTSSKNLRVSFNVPTYLKEYYLTEDSSCTAGGTWKTMAPVNQFTAQTNNANLTLYARFRDTFGNESECVSSAIPYVPSSISIVGPANSTYLGTTVEFTGICSDGGATVKISGTYSGETTCTAQSMWSKSFPIGNIPNNATINVDAELVIAGATVASASRSYTVQRHVTPTYPIDNGYVGLSFTLSGTCSPNGATINVTAPSATTVTCANGEWSVLQTVTGNDGDTITINGNLTFQNVIQDTFSLQTKLSTQPPVAVVSGVPNGKSSIPNLSMIVGGIGVSSYKFKFGVGISCSSLAGYSAEQSIEAGLFVNQSTFSVNDTITLCVVGKSGLNGLWQDYSQATVHSWQKSGLNYASLTGPSQVVAEGESGVTLGVTLSALSSAPVRVYFQTYGDALYMVDHNLYPGYIEVPAGQLSAQVTFDSLNNNLETKDSTLGVYLTHTNQPEFFVGENHSKHYMLRDPVRSSQKLIGFAHGSDNNPPPACALTEDGRLRCWGLGSSAPTGIAEPLPAMRFKQVVGSRIHFCALSDQDDLYCAAYGNFTATNYDPGIKYKSIALKQYIGCGITSDDRVRCWATDGSRLTLYIDDGVVKFKKVSPSHGTICAISLTDDLYCYGENTYKTIANNATANYGVLTLVDSGTKYSDVTSYTYVCGITLTNQQLRCWGRNDYYQVGNGTNTATTTPAIIDGSTKYLKISGSNTKACAITENFKLKCWGGEIIGGYTATQEKKIYSTPTLLNSNLVWKTVQANEGTICGIADDDLAYCFGDDTNYRTAIKGVRGELTLIDYGGQYIDYAVNGGASICAIRNDGAAVCSGYNGSAISRLSPRVIQPSVNFTGGKVLETSDSMSCVLTPAASYCARYNFFGHLADGTTTSTKLDYTPTGGIAIQGYTANTYCAAAVGTDGHLKSWGSGSGGAMPCPNTLTAQPSKILPSVLFKPVLGSHGTDSMCALSQSNEIYCWGLGLIKRGTGNSSTPTSVDPSNRYTDFKIAGNRLCGILETSSQIRCWGDNTNGKLGNNSTTNSTGSAVQGGHSYSKLGMNDNITCALRGTTLDCWGGLTAHNSLVPFTMNGGAAYKDFAVSVNDVIAITTSGEVHIWEDSLFKNAPRVITPAGVTFKSVKAAPNHYTYCALSTADKLYCRDINGPIDTHHHLHQVRQARF